MPTRRRSHRRAQRKTPTIPAVDRILRAVEADPRGFIDGATKLVKNVTEETRKVGKAIDGDPDGFRRALHEEGVRLVAKMVRGT